MRLKAFCVVLVKPRPASSEPTIADHESDGAAFQRVEFQLVAEDRELPERAVEDALLLARVPCSTNPSTVTITSSSGKIEDEGVVGDQRGELPGLVIAELLEHRGDEAQAGPPLAG